MELWNMVRNVLEKDTRRNMPVIDEKPLTISVQGIFKKAQSLRQKIKPAKTVQQIFQEARKSVKASEKLRQKAPSQIKSVLPKIGYYIIFALIAFLGIKWIISEIVDRIFSELASISTPVGYFICIVLFILAGMFFDDD